MLSQIIYLQPEGQGKYYQPLLVPGTWDENKRILQ